MTINDTLYLDIPANFGTDQNYEITEEISYVMDQLDDTVKTAWGVSQFVIISDDWEEVIKIPFVGGYFYWEDCGKEKECDFEEWSKDYCQYSLDLYHKACAEKIDPIFAKMRFVGTAINGAKIYAQEKIVIDHASSKIEYSEDSLNKVRNKQKNYVAGWSRFKCCWLAAAIDCYGEEIVNNFIKFCYDNDISDTHEYNYGYREDGSPVIFDYGSFDE